MTPDRKVSQVNKHFVLIDQSIKTLGGHHFEYAERILDAARKRGFETRVLSHRAFSDEKASSHRVIPVFQRTFWENTQPSAPAFESLKQRYTMLRSYLARISNAKRRMSLRWTYGWLGYHQLWAWESALNGTKILSTSGLARGAAPMLALTFKLLWYAILKLKQSKIIRWIGVRLRNSFRALVATLAILLSALALPATLLQQLMSTGWASFRSASRLFERDLQRGLANLRPDDIAYIFVPTLHTAELEGIRRFLKKHPEFRKVPWGLLYRRNILDGLPHEYPQQIDNIRALKATFTDVISSLPDANIRFMTDTDELTDQYNRLQVANFITVPVPSDFTLAQRQNETNQRASCPNTITMSYIGDARDEKGYPFLLSCQRALSTTRLKDGTAKLLVQSNYNTPHGDPSTAAAHKLLRDCYSQGVELVYGPLDRTAYQNLIARTDLMLLPYSAKNYAARSSGVFAEALAAGIPTVVTSGTWMSNLLEAHRQQHLNDVFTRSERGQSHASPTQLLDSVTLPTERILKGVRINLPAEARFLVFNVRIDVDTDTPTYFDAYVTRLNFADVPSSSSSQVVKRVGLTTRIAFRIKQGENIWARVLPLTVGLPQAAISVTVEAYDAEEDLPLGFGGVIAGPRESDFVESVSEALNFFDHYSSSATALTERLSHIYDTQTLLDRILPFSERT
jgi:hypothetical protein